MIGEDESGHGFYDGDGAWEDAGIMAAARGEGGIIALRVDGLLGLEDGGGGFEGDAEEDFHAVGDAALDTARVVGCGADVAVFVGERVIMLGAVEGGGGEAGTDLEAFGGGD